MKNSKNIIETSLSYLIRKNGGSSNYFNIDDVRLNQDQESNEKNKIYLNFDSRSPTQKVFIFNPNINKRVEIVSLLVNSPNVEVYISDGKPVKNVQVSLVWPNMDGGHLNQDNLQHNSFDDEFLFARDFQKEYFELLFEVELEPLSLSSYKILKTAKKQKITNVTFYCNNFNELLPKSIMYFNHIESM